MAEAGGNRPWSGRTDGLPWMQQSLVVMLRFLPLWLLYGIMALVLPFYLFFGKGFKPMYRFFRTAFGYGALKSCGYVWRNHFQFGQVVL
ncbi:MAG: acyltransferase, partial [Bacteroidales bacterium]|nr:acyltransferase [Bacteroidales bacterium]